MSHAIQKRPSQLLNILFIICFLLTTPAFAAESSLATTPSSGKVVKVFFPLQKDFSEQDENGYFSGYTYDYLMKIAQLTGWKYEFIVAESTNDNLTTGLDSLKNGELDLIGAMNFTPQLAKQYSYASMPYGEMNHTLITQRKNQSLNDRTIFEYPGLKVALVEKAFVANQLFHDFCMARNLQYQPVYAENSIECQKLVALGQADALIGKDVALESDYKSVLPFSKQPFYFASSKENTELMRELNWALTAINSASPDFQKDLHRKYFSKSFDYDLSLTADEHDYLQQVPTIRIAIPIGGAPVQDYDEQSGQFSGIMIDVLEVISERSGLQFEFLPASDKIQAEEMIRTGTADIIAGLPYDFESLAERNNSEVVLTSPILSMPIVRVTNQSMAAVFPKTLVYENIKFSNERVDITYENDIQKILKQIASGEYSEAFVNSYMAQYYLERGDFHGITLTQTPYSNYSICIGIARIHDPHLISILEQAISTLNSDELESIIFQNTSYFNQVGILDIIRRNPLPFTLSGFAVLTLLSLLLLSLFIKSRRINQLVSAEGARYKILSQIDGLSQIYNNMTFRQMSADYLAQTSPPPRGALIILDIDHFKDINDTLGHLEGDKVLRKLSALLKSSFPGQDFVGRLGGDEFAALMKEVTDQKIIASRCEDLIRRSQLSLHHKKKITLSIGVIMFSDTENFETLFRQADKALYEIKNCGRNGYRIHIFDATASNNL